MRELETHLDRTTVRTRLLILAELYQDGQLSRRDYDRKRSRLRAQAGTPLPQFDAQDGLAWLRGKTVAAVTRSAAEGQADRLHRNQSAILQEGCARYGVVLVGTTNVLGSSASREVLALAKSGGADVIALECVERLCRDDAELWNTLVEAAVDCGTPVWFVEEGVVCGVHEDWVSQVRSLTATCQGLTTHQRAAQVRRIRDGYRAKRGGW